MLSCLVTSKAFSIASILASSFSCSAISSIFFLRAQHFFRVTQKTMNIKTATTITNNECNKKDNDNNYIINKIYDNHDNDNNNNDKTKLYNI